MGLPLIGLLEAGSLQVAPDEVHIWRHNHGADMEPERLAGLLALLSPDEHERLARLRDPHRRRNFVVGRALCRRVLSHYAPVRPEDWRFGMGKRGKPVIAAPLVSSPLWFSLSHTDGVSVCAVTGASHAIGIDIEPVNSGKGGMEIAEQFFSEEEVVALRRLPPSLRNEVFVRFWVLKESFVKARETSLADGLSGTTFNLACLDNIEVTFAESLNERAEQWRFKLLELDEALIFALAVCTQATGPFKLRVGECLAL